MQMKNVECGAASPCMILAYYGRWITLEQARLDCGVSRDGSKMINILKAARRYGLKAGGKSISVNVHKENGTFPCVVFWQFGHCIVLDEFEGNKVIVNDPAKGNVRLSMEEFSEGFTVVAFVMFAGALMSLQGKVFLDQVLTDNHPEWLNALIVLLSLLACISGVVSIVNAIMLQYSFLLKGIVVATVRMMSRKRLNVAKQYRATVAGIEQVEV